MSELDLEISDWRLPYESRLAKRSPSLIDMVVIHCTELPDLPMAREFGEKILYQESQTGNSGHYYINRTGDIFRFVDDLRAAHHVHGYNQRSIGIELVNSGRYPNWKDSRHQTFRESYLAVQIDALMHLLKKLCGQYPDLKWIAGHEDIDKRLEPATDNSSILLPRRRDPGPLFPWQKIMSVISLKRFGIEHSAQ